MFFFQREHCMCQRDTILVLLRLTAGLLPTPPAHPRSIYLEDELQFMFVCEKRKCSYRQSVPQIQSRKTSLRCVCGEKCVYHIDKQIYSCPKLNGGCGVCLHELDSFTYMHTEICLEETEDFSWVCLRKDASKICELKGILKYRLNENLMNSEMVYERRKDSKCKIIKRNIMTPAILVDGVEI